MKKTLVSAAAALLVVIPFLVPSTALAQTTGLLLSGLLVVIRCPSQQLARL
jgi:hypothetical protein